MTWTFGINGFDENNNYSVVEKPLYYESQLHCSDNPSIFDENGGEYDVFNRKYLPLLPAAPDLLVALEDVLSAVEPLSAQGYHFVNKANSLIEKVKGGLNG